MTEGSFQHVTVDEHMASLKRSSIPTIIVEGDDDIVIYRFIERKFGAVSISVLPVGGRENVLEIFGRRNEIEVPVFFIADRDNWCITGVPAEFSSDQLALTTGYSIENDVIYDGKFVTYLKEDEALRLENELETFIDWYALALNRHLTLAGGAIKTHPNVILGDDASCTQLCQLFDGESYPVELKERLRANPYDLVRGKSVFAVLMRQLSYPGRVPKHHHLALMEMVGANPGDRIGGLFDCVLSFFNFSSLDESAIIDAQ